MNLSEYLKPAMAVVFFAALGGAWYWFEHRPHPEEKETSSNALVVVTKSTHACFSDSVRVTGFVVPRREAVVGVDQEGSKVSEVLVREGDTVTDNQELARQTPPPAQPAPREPAAEGHPRRPCGLRLPASSPRSRPSPARRPHPRPDRCSGFPSTTKSNSMPRFRAFICSNSIQERTHGSAGITGRTFSDASG